MPLVLFSEPQEEQQRLFQQSVQAWRKMSGRGAVPQNTDAAGGGAKSTVAKDEAPALPTPAVSSQTAVDVNDTAAPSSITDAELDELLEHYDLEVVASSARIA